MIEVPGTEQVIATQLVLLAMGFVSPLASLLECVRRRARPARQCESDDGADRRLRDQRAEGVRCRRRPPRPVARRLGDPRRPPGGARRRRVPHGLQRAAAMSGLRGSPCGRMRGASAGAERARRPPGHARRRRVPHGLQRAASLMAELHATAAATGISRATRWSRSTTSSSATTRAGRSSTTSRWPSAAARSPRSSAARAAARRRCCA